MPKLKNFEYFFRIFWSGLCIIILGTIQVGFFSALPRPFNYFNLILSAAVFITFALDYGKGLWFAFFSGLIIDLFSYLPFGTMTFLMMITVVSVNALFNNFFTNRSLYSLISLGVLANLIYAAGLLFFNFIFFVLGTANNLEKFLSAPNILGMLWQSVFGIGLLLILFFSFTFLSKKLK
jgi:cell shape-determining protein MreD